MDNILSLDIGDDPGFGFSMPAIDAELFLVTVFIVTPSTQGFGFIATNAKIRKSNNIIILQFLISLFALLMMFCLFCFSL